MSVVAVESVDQYKELVATQDKLVRLEAGGGPDVVVVVDFTATWCGPCKKIAPVFDELAQKHTDAVFLKVDVDKLADLPECAAIRGVPTFRFVKNGSVVAEVVGANSDKLTAAVSANL